MRWLHVPSHPRLRYTCALPQKGGSFGVLTTMDWSSACSRLVKRLWETVVEVVSDSLWWFLIDGAFTCGHSQNGVSHAHEHTHYLVLDNQWLEWKCRRIRWSQMCLTTLIVAWFPANQQLNDNTELKGALNRSIRMTYLTVSFMSVFADNFQGSIIL